MEGKSFGSDELWMGKSHKVPLMKTNGQNQDHRQHAGCWDGVSSYYYYYQMLLSTLLYKFATVLSVLSDGRMELEQGEGEHCGPLSAGAVRVSPWLFCTE